MAGEVKVIVRRDGDWSCIEFVRGNRYFSISVSKDPPSIVASNSYFVGRILISENHYRELMETLNEKDISRMLLRLIAIINEIREMKEIESRKLLEDLGNRFVDQALKLLAGSQGLSERERGYIVLRVIGAIKEKIR